MPGSEPGDVVAAQQPPARRARAAAGRASWRARSGRRRRAVECVHRLRRYGEHVGRRGQERQRHVVAARCSRRGQLVDRHRDPRVGGAVGVDVVADAPACPAARRSQRSTAGTSSSRSTPGDLRRALRRWPRRHRATTRVPAPSLGERSAPAPRSPAGQVDGRDPRAPAHQRRQRSHLGAGAEHGDRVPLEPQPVGVGEHLLDRLGDASARPRRPRPSRRAAPDAVAAQPLAAVGQHQLVAPARPSPTTSTPSSSCAGSSGHVAERVLARPSPATRIRSCSESRPSLRDRRCAASGESSPASTSRRKCTR